MVATGRSHARGVASRHGILRAFVLVFTSLVLHARSLALRGDAILADAEEAVKLVGMASTALAAKAAKKAVAAVVQRKVTKRARRHVQQRVREPMIRCDGGLYVSKPWASNHNQYGFFDWATMNGGPANTSGSKGKGRLTVYVQFSKVGSDTVRELIGDVLGGDQTPDFCFMHSKGMRRGSGRNTSLVNARVVQGKYGLCDTRQARGRTCSYFTVLRDPVEAMLSQYSYFCLNCREHQRHCNNSNIRVNASGAICPRMDLLDYAHLMGNVYVHEFSGAYACSPCPSVASGGELPLGPDGKPYLCKPYPETCGPLRSAGPAAAAQPPDDVVLLERAKENLARDVLPLVLDELDGDDGELVEGVLGNGTAPPQLQGVDLLARAFGWSRLLELRRGLRRLVPHRDHGVAAALRYAPTAEELKGLRAFLAPDLALYEHARRLSREAAGVLADWDGWTA